MKFQLKPILSEIKDLYSKPISPERFNQYISKLQGDTKGDLALPIGGFNPMAKEHILTKISELESFDAERIMEETIKEFNKELSNSPSKEIMVVLNIADDLKGGWTNFYATDFDSKFKLNALVKRNFCTPYFWTSETYSEEIIRVRTMEYLARTLYRFNNPQPKTIEEHLKQEIYVAQKTNKTSRKKPDATRFSQIESFYNENKNSEEYSKIFNFFYNDQGSESLGYQKYGLKTKTGYEYAALIAEERKPPTNKMMSKSYSVRKTKE
nr:hypothetical protein [Allomuricauda sp.]